MRSTILPYPKAGNKIEGTELGSRETQSPTHLGGVDAVPALATQLRLRIAGKDHTIFLFLMRALKWN